MNTSGSTKTVDLTDPSENIWECQIGGRLGHGLPGAADWPMRQAVEEAFKRITGREAEFTFSGWGSKLSEGRRAVIENRIPDRDKEIAEARELLRIVDYKTEQPDEPAASADEPRAVLLDMTLRQYAQAARRDACGAWSDIVIPPYAGLDESKCQLAAAIEDRLKKVIDELADLSRPTAETKEAPAVEPADDDDLENPKCSMPGCQNPKAVCHRELCMEHIMEKAKEIAPEPVAVSGWVIEGAWSPIDTPDYWVGSSAWSPDAYKALRFATLKDAQQAADMMCSGLSVRLCEHEWAEQPETKAEKL